jgi:hypothetical protein
MLSAYCSAKQCYLRVTRFWTSSIVSYSKEQNVAETGSVSVLKWGGGRHLLCWVLQKELTSYHWTDPISETLYSLEYRTMDNVQKPIHRESYTPSSESFRIHHGTYPVLYFGFPSILFYDEPRMETKMQSIFVKFEVLTAVVSLGYNVVQSVESQRRFHKAFFRERNGGMLFCITGLPYWRYERPNIS